MKPSTKMIIGNILCRHSGLDPESSDFLRKPLDSCFRRNDTSVWLTKEHKKSPSLLPLPSREGNLKFSLAPWGLGVNLRRKIMDLIIKSPSFPLFQRGMFYDSPLFPFTKGGCFMIPLFGKEGLGEILRIISLHSFYMIIVHKFGSFSLQVGKVPLPSRERGEREVQGKCPIVGVGASAGGLESFTQLFEKLPVDTGMAFVFVQHLAASHESILTELLSKATSMPVMVKQLSGMLPICGYCKQIREELDR